MSADSVSVERVESPWEFYSSFIVGDSYCLVCDSLIEGVEEIEGNRSELVKAHLRCLHGFDV